MQRDVRVDCSMANEDSSKCALLFPKALQYRSYQRREENVHTEEQKIHKSGLYHLSSLSDPKSHLVKVA